MKLLAAVLFAVTILAPASYSQTEKDLTTPPSTAEILELANKADEKIGDFERVLKAAEPHLDANDVKAYREGAANIHLIVAAIRKNGVSNYSLVGLLSGLDDLTLDAARASRSLLMIYSQDLAKGKDANQDVISTTMAFITVEKSLYDMSDLFLHATLRMAAFEDKIMDKLSKGDGQ